MAWLVRTRNRPTIRPGRNVPDYVAGNGDFTIRMYHSGYFLKNVGRTTYFGGDISHIDFCNSDELSMLEINYMAAEIGLLGELVFHYSTNGVDDCASLMVMQEDLDALNLINFVDENGMVGLYVEHKSNQTQSTIRHC